MSEHGNQEILPIINFDHNTDIGPGSPYYPAGILFPPGNNYRKPMLRGIGNVHRGTDDFAITTIGSRAITPEAIETCNYFISNLAREGLLIISGLALGIDSVALEAAIAVGGRSYVFLPSGLAPECIYPQENVNNGLVGRVKKHGMLWSQFADNFRKTPKSPLDRNHYTVLSGLLTLVIYGTWTNGQVGRSGTMASVNRAEEYGRKIIAVPGSEVTDYLIGTGKASPALNYMDVFNEAVEIYKQRKYIIKKYESDNR